jgi:phosphate transport system permease protein
MTGASMNRDRFGLAMTWLTGGALATNLVLVVGMIGIIAVQGLSSFWPRPLEELRLDDGTVVLGEIHEREAVPGAKLDPAGEVPTRVRVKIGNRDLYRLDFRWIDEVRVVSRSLPQNVVAVERLEWGAFLGYLEQESPLVVRAASGERREISADAVTRIVFPNQLGVTGRLGLYAVRVWEFLTTEPRESNTEGGIFPAIFGTVMMVLIMSIVVAPFGVLAAVYMHEYAREGTLLRLVRIAVNNLAGVPSIVFGIFGLGFFVYGIGGSVDQLFYADALPTPTYGTGGILWASLTLALLTVPVVIVATEEGLSAVPRSLREASRALGATHFETVARVILPSAAPGVLTGLILAMSRATGEVAPLMIVGMVKMAPALPIDGLFPFLHLERKFMHLGFHIYDLGFQSPNVEAVKPLVFATALLLILVVLATNLTAILLRNHLRSRYAARGL